MNKVTKNVRVTDPVISHIEGQRLAKWQIAKLQNEISKLLTLICGTHSQDNRASRQLSLKTRKESDLICSNLIKENNKSQISYAITQEETNVYQLTNIDKNFDQNFTEDAKNIYSHICNDLSNQKETSEKYFDNVRKEPTPATKSVSLSYRPSKGYQRQQIDISPVINQPIRSRCYVYPSISVCS